jgi:hypothetical protein
LLDSARRARRKALEGGGRGAPYLFPIALTLVALAAGWWLKDAAPRLGGALEAPEQQVRRTLAKLTTARLEDVYGHESGGLAELTQLRFADVTVTMLDGERASVLAMAEGDGRVAWRGQVASLGYVGREAFTMRPCQFAGWCAEGEALSQLRPILRLLFRRLDAFNGRDAAAYGRLVAEGYRGPGGRAAVLSRLAADLGSGPPATLRVTAWQIRLERDVATVGEDETVAVGGGAPVALRARLELVREGGRWVIAGGL